MKNSTKPICGAKAKQTGKPCEKPPLKGKDRCKLHGGATPKGQNAGKANGNRTHGLYGKHLSDDERAVWDDIPVGDVVNEIKLCRIWLMRAMSIDAGIAKAPNDPKNTDGFELTEVRRSTGGGKTQTDAISKRPDIAGRVNWVLGRLAQLEKTRAELLAAASEKGGDDDSPLPWVD
jgi:hypothetical protein